MLQTCAEPAYYAVWATTCEKVAGVLFRVLQLVPGSVTLLLYEDAVSCVSTVSHHIANYPLTIPHLSADFLTPPLYTHTHTSPFQISSKYGHATYTEHRVI